MNPGIATKALSCGTVLQSEHQEKKSATVFASISLFFRNDLTMNSQILRRSRIILPIKQQIYRRTPSQNSILHRLLVVKVHAKNPKVQIITFKIKASFFPHCFLLLNTMIQTLTQEIPNTLIVSTRVVEGFPKHLSRLLSPLFSCATQ